MAEALEELKLDCEEVKKLLGLSTRQRVKDILSIEQRKIETQIKKKEDEIAASNKTNSDQAGAEGGEATVAAPKPETKTRVYTVKITSYGWDQSEKFVKLYITLKGVHTIPKENCKVKYDDVSVNVFVGSLDGKNHELIINNLLKPILPVDSHFKVKTDTLIVFLKKKDKATWEYVTAKEMKAKEKKSPDYSKAKDPNESIMELMKNMYDEGDDEMKRSIAKAWTESRNKTPGAPGMPGAPGAPGAPGGDMFGGMEGLGGLGGLGGMMEGLGGLGGMGGK
ncbi:calcyclin-binding protein-like [Glandiceps talaboti]